MKEAFSFIPHWCWNGRGILMFALTSAALWIMLLIVRRCIQAVLIFENTSYEG
jgi:hypothetical protein